MIVEPDYFNHHKVRCLIALLDTELAEVLPLRLWAHCQQRRQWVFDLDPRRLAAILRWSGNVDDLWEAMTDPADGWLVPAGDKWEVRDWASYNAGLIANWKNGKKGGRPVKSIKPNQNPFSDWVSDGLTQSKPNPEMGSRWVNPSKTDKIREDKRREETPPQTRAREPEPPSVAEAKALAEQSGIDPECAVTWWHEADGAGWVDGKGRPIRNWRSALVAYGRKWAANDFRRRGGAPLPEQKQPRPAQPWDKPPCDDWLLVALTVFDSDEFPKDTRWMDLPADIRREIHAHHAKQEHPA